jgi:cytosine deaminase
MLQLLIRNATLLDGGLTSIAIEGGRITAIGMLDEAIAETTIDAGGRVVLPSFVNAHLHVDKALTVGATTDWSAGTFQESIDMTLDFRRGYSVEDILVRGRTVLDSCVLYGTGTLRAFADVGTVGGLVPVEGLLVLREEYRDLLDIQIVAFPQEGLLRDPGAAHLVGEAMEAGCDVVGGFPWFELTNEYSAEHIRQVFEIARRFDADIHAFVDDEPIAPTTYDLEQLAMATIRSGWEGRVTVSHACGLASYDDHRADRTMRLVAEAGISVVSNAHISLVSKCQHAPEPKPRGITRVRELIEHGVNVATAQDDIADPYYPFGRGDMLEVAGYLAHVAQLYRPEETPVALGAVTTAPARALRIPDYGLTVGSLADLVVLDAGRDATEILRLQPACRWVVKRGRIVAETQISSILRGERA